jgi:hypothetical protein
MSVLHLSHRERSARVSAPGEGLQTIEGTNPLTPTLSPKGRGSMPVFAAIGVLVRESLNAR